MAEAVLFLFDGYNLLHEAGMEDPDALVDRLAGFVALRGATGVVVFDGAGAERSVGPLRVRYAQHADDVLERLAAEHRSRGEVVVVTSDRAVLGTAGQESRRFSSKSFLRELELSDAEDVAASLPGSGRTTRVGEALPDETREQLERWRRQKR